MQSEPHHPIPARRLRIGMRLQLWLLCSATALSGLLAIGVGIHAHESERRQAEWLRGLAQLQPVLVSPADRAAAQALVEQAERAGLQRHHPPLAAALLAWKQAIGPVRAGASKADGAAPEPAAASAEAAARREVGTQWALGTELVHRSEARWQALSLALFLAVMLVSALAIEPTYRAIRRQRHRLQRQAADLERLALVARLTSNSVLIADEAGRIEWINDGFTRLWGHGTDEAQGRTLTELLASERTDPARLSGLEAALRQGVGFRTEILFRGKDGVDRWVDMDLQPRHHPDGSLRGSIAIATDVTDLVRERQHQAAILEAVPTGVMVFDRNGQVGDCNAVAASLLGQPRTQLIGMPLQGLHGSVLGDDLKPIALAELPTARALATAQAQRSASLGVVTPDGELRWLLINAQPILDASGRVDRVISSFVDVSALRKHERVMAATVEGAGLGLWEWDLRSNSTSCNERVARLLGYTQAEFEAQRRGLLQLLHPEDRARWLQVVSEHLKDGQQACRLEVRLRRPDGEWAWATASGAVVERGAAGQPLRMAGVLVDMTEHMQMQAMLLHASRTDNLTQLPNRALLMERLAGALGRWQQDPSRRFALLYMDFDRFKLVNDTHGHAVGDGLLRLIAERLLQALRKTETRSRRRGGQPAVLPARISGDEFVVLLEGIEGPAAALAVGERLLAALADPYTLAPTLRVHSSASIGIVTSDQCDAKTDAHGVLRDADTAMYEAKRAGRARMVMFDPAMHQALARRSELEAELRLAIGSGQIQPAYQPIIELATGQVVGVEALARWQHPVRGAVSPAEFIPVAEDSGLITALGAAMLEASCRDFVLWQSRLGESAPQSLAVNLSRAQLLDEGLPAQVQRILQDTGIAPHRLQLEVTESMAGEESSVPDALRRLKTLGLTLALDDFGTGYSSLACLHQLPVDVVKIDRSFVRDAQANEVHRVLIQATVQMARALGMGTVAEGIEHDSQAQLVQSLGCEKAQGFLYSRPVPSAELQQWLQARELRAAA